jgi:hypothetical protein
MGRTENAFTVPSLTLSSALMVLYKEELHLFFILRFESLFYGNPGLDLRLDMGRLQPYFYDN